jgi:hypothetical protein
MVCGSDVCWWTGAPASALGPTGPGYIALLENGAVTTISAAVYPWSLAFDGSSFFETVGCDLCSGTLLSIVEGLDLPSNDGDDIPASGIYSVAKQYADPMLPPPSAGGASRRPMSTAGP